MNNYNFADHLIKCQREQGSVLICGLDPQLEHIPKFLFLKYAHIKDPFEMAMKVIIDFNTQIIEAVYPFVSGFKPQAGFYEPYGSEGWQALEETFKIVKQTGLVDVLDAKRGDGGDTAKAYAGLLTDIKLPFVEDGGVILKEFPGLDVNCMTANIWIGDAFMQPMLEKINPLGKGLMCVNRTSFKPQSKIEDLPVLTLPHPVSVPLWQAAAEMVKKWSQGTEGKEGYSPIGVVLGATCEGDSDYFRENLSHNIKLLPGYGKQGGGASGAVRSFNKDGFGGMVNSSRQIIYAYKFSEFACDEKDFAKAAAKEARRSRDELYEALNEHIKEVA